MYYLRTRPAVDAIKFTVDQTALKESEEEPSVEDVEKNLAAMVCSLENPEACTMCSG
jgi:ribonucleoside-diphosphate reductase subunit M1